MIAEDRWLSVQDLVKYLGVSRDTVYAWLCKKALPGHRVGRLWKFKRDEIDEWVRAGDAAAPSVPNPLEAMRENASNTTGAKRRGHARRKIVKEI